MQICLIVTIKFLFIALAVYLVDSPTQQMTKHTSPSIRLKTDTPRKFYVHSASAEIKNYHKAKAIKLSVPQSSAFSK